MSELILHQYPSSPFSEKVRIMLGLKGLTYRSVQVPMAPPKPDVLALTGGYRRTPVLQIGCDIYCDTRLIARVLDQVAPEPALRPVGLEAVSSMLTQWADQSLFPSVTPFAFKPEALARIAGDVPREGAEAFLEDRMAMAKTARVRPLGRLAFDHLPVYLELLNQQLDVSEYLVTDRPTEADCAVYHCLWFVSRGLPDLLATYPAIGRYMGRIAAIGHGTPTALSSGEAIGICRGASPRDGGHSLPESGNGIALGAAVQVAPADYGLEPTEGELVHLAADEVVIRRTDERAGTVHVHFPRVGYQLKPAR